MGISLHPEQSFLSRDLKIGRPTTSRLELFCQRSTDLSFLLSPVAAPRNPSVSEAGEEDSVLEGRAVREELRSLEAEMPGDALAQRLPVCPALQLPTHTARAPQHRAALCRRVTALVRGPGSRYSKE